MGKIIVSDGNNRESITSLNNKDKILSDKIQMGHIHNN